MPIGSLPIPNSLSGFQVLLVETEKRTLQHHAYVLIQASYRVTSTVKVSEALSMIIHGNPFDCVLVDAQNLDMDLVDFLHTVWTHRPHLRIIVMTASESHMQLGREGLANDVIWFLRKPCAVSKICNILQRVCENRLAIGEGTGKPPEQNRNGKMVQKADTMFPSTVFNIPVINNNASSSKGYHQGLNINSQKYGAMPVSYVDISSDDDNMATANKYGKAKNKDKGKKPIEQKRKNEPLAKYGINSQKKKDTNLCIDWTPALLGKFLEGSTSLGKEGAYPKATINHYMPSLAHAQVMSPLQRIQERDNFNKKPRGINYLQAESHTYKRSGLSTTSNNNLSSSSLRKAFNRNKTGVSYAICNKIVGLRGGPRPLPQQITSTINNSTGDQAIKSSYEFQPLIGETLARFPGGPQLLPQQITTTINSSAGDQAINSSYQFQPLIGKNVARLPGSPQLLQQQITTTINNLAGDQAIKSSYQFQPLIGETSISGGFVSAGGSASRLPRGPQLSPQQITTTVNNSAGDQAIKSSYQFQPLIGETSMSGGCVGAGPGGPQQITNTINNSTGDQAIKSSYEFQPLIGETSMSGSCVGAGGSAFSHGLAPFDHFGIPIESCLTVGDSVKASNNAGLDDFTISEVISHDLGGVSHPQEFQGDGEYLSDFEKALDIFVNGSTSSSHPSSSGVESNSEEQIQASGNSIVPLVDSEGRVIDHEWFINLLHD